MIINKLYFVKVTHNSSADKPVALLKYTNTYEGQLKRLFTLTGKNYEILRNGTTEQSKN